LTNPTAKTAAAASGPRFGAPQWGVRVDERVLSGRLSGVMYLTGAAGLALVLVLPGAGQLDEPLLWTICAAAAAWGAISLLALPWRTVAPWVIHASCTSGFAIIGAVVWAGGGATSPLRFFLFFIVVFAAYFFPRRVAALYLAGCCAVHALPVVYDGSAISVGFLRELAVIVPVYVVPGAAIIAGKELLVGLREDAERSRARERRTWATQLALLAAQASTDPLTGLLNHRAFHERVAQDVSRSHRHGHALALAMIDIDHFKEVNDSAGHAAGDRILVELAERARQIARTEDVLGRVGGDELAWLLPESEPLQALSAVERLRESIRAEPIVGYRVTISAGICGLEDAHEAERLFELADGALYWSKAHGRDVSWIYDPDVVQELSADERAEHLERSHALRALRALARAIDAKDPLTRRHSDRVAELAARLAVASGWSTERVEQLREAALIHDVGKIGVPDAVLLHAGPLEAAERRQVQQHAALSAQIAEEVLAPEQVSWIACHHERPDGTGYPRGLGGEQIPEGAALLALADAWDVMTISRPYSAPKAPEQALTECLAAEGTQFTEGACAALLALSGEGALTATATAPSGSAPAPAA
jgi:diguanylate cyclase (GGDEF)-like protein